MTYKVYSVIYDSLGKEGLCAVAVSGTSKKAAIARLRDNRPANVIQAAEIVGRKPEYYQNRIEGTCNLLNPQDPPPQADTPESRAIRESNAEHIRALMASGQIAQ